MEAYFLNSSECSGCFRFVCSYALTGGVGDEWSSESQTSLTNVDIETCISCISGPGGFLFPVQILLPE